MVIHSASDPRPRTALCGDYFYNYFSRGIDILFDGQVRKLNLCFPSTSTPVFVLKWAFVIRYQFHC